MSCLQIEELGIEAV